MLLRYSDIQEVSTSLPSFLANILSLPPTLLPRYRLIIYTLPPPPYPRPNTLSAELRGAVQVPPAVEDECPQHALRETYYDLFLLTPSFGIPGYVITSLITNCYL
jgi:hypothetical protein